MAVRNDAPKFWAAEWEDGERWECRSLFKLLWQLHCPRWIRRVGWAWEDFRYRFPCYLRGHKWRYFDPEPDLKDARECDRCGKFEALDD